MSSDDEAFNTFIIMSEDEENSKENVTVKQPKTSQNQYDVLISFTKAIDAHKVSKQEYEHRWKELADKLNEIGPPIRDRWEWRRVWSVYKYNQKRKQPATAQPRKRRSRQDPLRNVCPPGDSVQNALALSDVIQPATVPIDEDRSRQDPLRNVCPPGDSVQNALALSDVIQPATVPIDEDGSQQDPLRNVCPPFDPVRIGLAMSDGIQPATVPTDDPLRNVCPPCDPVQSGSELSENFLQCIAIQALEKLDRISSTLCDSYNLLKNLVENPQRE